MTRRILMRTLAATVLCAALMAPSAATAAESQAEQLAAVCNTYLDNNQTEDAARQAQLLLEFEGLFFAEARVEAERCFTRLHGAPWVYSFKTSTFLPEDEVEAAEQALDARRQERQRQIEEQERRDQKAREEAERQLAEERAKAEERAAAAQRRLADRRFEATVKTREACDELYRRDWISALTNTVCSPFYLTNGLPD